jgi:hypothetical protein
VTEPTLESARRKLGRADELLRELEAEIAKSAEEITTRQRAGNPPIEVALIPEPPWLIAMCTAVHERPSPRWGLLAGDAMHNARSALDHLACRLVELAGNTPTRTTAFPIWPDAPETRKDTARFERTLKGMGSAHQDSIRALQPYRNPGTWEAERLTALAALDNADKHQLLVPLQATLSKKDVKTLTNIPSAWYGVRWNFDAAIEPGVEIVRYRSYRLKLPPEQIIASIRLKVAFGDPRYGRTELEEIRAYVVGIVESFAPEFG